MDGLSPNENSSSAIDVTFKPLPDNPNYNDIITISWNDYNGYLDPKAIHINCTGEIRPSNAKCEIKLSKEFPTIPLGTPTTFSEGTLTLTNTTKSLDIIDTLRLKKIKSSDHFHITAINQALVSQDRMPELQYDLKGG
jgi:hypothetical protein